MGTAEFEELKNESLIQLASNNSSTELWLIQWPFDHHKTNTPWPKIADFDGQEATFNLNSETQFGSLNTSSGKSYELRCMQSYVPEEVVFLSSASETKSVGNISRHVSLVHYPEPSEIQKPDNEITRKYEHGSFATSLTGSARRTATPTQTIRPRHQGSTGTTSNHSSRKKGSSSIVTGSLEPSKSKKRKHSNDASGSHGHSDRDSGRAHSTVTSSGGSLNRHSDRDSGRGHSTVTSSGGSLNQSQERKSNKKRKKESQTEG